VLLSFGFGTANSISSKLLVASVVKF